MSVTLYNFRNSRQCFDMAASHFLITFLNVLANKKIRLRSRRPGLPRRLKIKHEYDVQPRREQDKSLILGNLRTKLFCVGGWGRRLEGKESHCKRQTSGSGPADPRKPFAFPTLSSPTPLDMNCVEHEPCRT